MPEHDIVSAAGVDAAGLGVAGLTPVEVSAVEPNAIGLAPIVAADAEPLKVEVFEETVSVGKRLVESGSARVQIDVTEHDETIRTLLMRQDVSVERVPVGSIVETAPPVRHEGNTIIVSVLEEIVVVEKRLLLKEELHIRVTETNATDTQVVRLRREHVDIAVTGDATSGASPSDKKDVR